MVPRVGCRDAKSLIGSDSFEVAVAFPIGNGAVVGVAFGLVEVAVVLDDFATEQASRCLTGSEHGRCLAQRCRNALYVG